MKFRIYFLLSLFFLVFSLWPTWYELQHRDRLPPIRAFELVHNFPTDFNFYLSRIRQGIEGRTNVIEQYTSESHEGSYIHVMYLALGWVGRLVRVPWGRSADVYHMARIVLGMTLLLLTAVYALNSFSNLKSSSRLKNLWPLFAFLLAVTASTWPKLVAVDGSWRFGGYMAWWSVMDSLQRITFIPHLLAGQALMLTLIMVLSGESWIRRVGNWFFLGMLGFILGIIFPPGLIFVYATVFILLFLDILRIVLEKKFSFKRYFDGAVLPRVIVMLLSAPALLYLNLMVSFYPWKRLAEFDIIKPLPFDYLEYVKAMGYILPLGLFGLVIAIWKKEKYMVPSMAWVLAWVSLLGIFKFVPQQSPLRFSEMLPHVPLAILAAYVFLVLAQHIQQKKFPVISSLPYIVPISFIVLGGGIMFSSWLWQRDFVDHKMRASLPLVPTGSYVMYPLKDFLSAIYFLQDATARSEVILSETTAGNYIPVYSGNTVYVGHANTVHSEAKEAFVKKFYRGKMTQEEARVWLGENNLHYVFFGPQEKEDGGVTDLSRIYPFLREIYKNGFVKIYTTNR